MAWTEAARVQHGRPHDDRQDDLTDPGGCRRALGRVRWIRRSEAMFGSIYSENLLRLRMRMPPSGERTP